MTDGSGLSPQEVAWRAGRAETEIGGLTDWELIGSITPRGISYPMEMDRRLKVAVISLTAEIVMFRKSSERLTRWLIGFTAGLLILTAVLVWLTVILARKG